MRVVQSTIEIQSTFVLHLLPQMNRFRLSECEFGLTREGFGCTPPLFSLTYVQATSSNRRCHPISLTDRGMTRSVW